MTARERLLVIDLQRRVAELEARFAPSALPVTMEYISARVAQASGLSVDELLERRRPARIVWTRQLGMYLCHAVLGEPSGAIAAAFRRRDHGTALNAIGAVESILATNATRAVQVRQWIEKLRNVCVSDGAADAPELTRSAGGPFAARNG